MKHDFNTYGKSLTKCHFCSGPSLRRVLDLGKQPHSDDFVEQERLEQAEVFFPLKLVSCGDCGLLQINYYVNPDILYRTNYVYESSITKTGVAHYEEMSKTISDRFKFPESSLVVDIGSNVGVLLNGFKKNGHSVLGVDPAKKVAKKAIENGIPTIIDFFNEEVADEILANYNPVSIVTGTNVFAHLHDVHSAMRGIKKILASEGVLVIEAPYALEMIEKNEYDTIYHQHIGYLAVKPMQQFFTQYDMDLFDIEYKTIHGGTIRYFVGHKDSHRVSDSIEKYISKEEEFGLYDEVRLEQFRAGVELQRSQLQTLLLGLKMDGKKIVGVSAPAKGNTLLNYCGLDSSILDFTTERSQLKIGKYTPGSSIPIVSDDELLRVQPDYALILAWNFAEEIMKNLDDYKKAGGKFIIPIPYPIII